MTKRMILATALAAAIAAGGGSAAQSATSVLRSCGKITAAGKTWTIAAAGVPCADARALVRKLAPKASRVGVSHATYRSLACYIAASKARGALIQCIGATGGKSVIARAP